MAKDKNDEHLDDDLDSEEQRRTARIDEHEDDDAFDLFDDLVDEELQSDEDSRVSEDEIAEANTFHGTVAIGEEDREYIEDLLQRDQEDENPDRTMMIDDTHPSVDAGTAGFESGSSGDVESGSKDSGSKPLKTWTVGSGTLGSSQLAEIWKKNAGSQAKPMMSIELTVPKKSALVEEYNLNPRIVESKTERVDSGINVDYQLKKLVGKGGMGEVFSAHQIAVDRQVAFKRIRSSLLEKKPKKRDSFSRKFLSEAHITARLDHPNIVTIHDLGIDQKDRVFYCMEFVNGSEWHHEFDDKTVDENVNILMSVADGIAFAHSHNIIHRDLKPENVMIGQFREVLIMDWGLAVDLDLGQPTNLAGTPAYLSPEMAKGPRKLINKSSDIYLLGAVLFHICTGSPPHRGRTVEECVKSAAKNDIQITQIHRESLRPLAEISLKAMATDQSERYASVEEFQAAIREFQARERSIQQSYEITDRSENELELAEKNRDYEKYSSALFGFREASNLYPENQQASKGVDRSKTAYASCALSQNDFELGLSLLDKTSESDQPLIRKIQKEQAKAESRQKRIRQLSWAAMGLLGAIAIISAGATLLINNSLREAQTAKNDAIKSGELEKEAKEDAIEAKENAVRAQKEAETAKEEAIEAKDDAEKARELEEKAKEVAIKAKDDAVKAQKQEQKAKEDALDAEQRAKESAKIAQAQTRLAVRETARAESNLFNSNINLADSQIRDNQIGAALATLQDMREISPDNLGWEYYRLWHLCHQGDDVVDDGGQNGSIGITPISSQRLVAVAQDGKVRVLDAKLSPGVDNTNEFATGIRAIVADATPDGSMIAIGASGTNKLTIWNAGGERLSNFSSDIQGNKIVRLRFSAGGNKLIACDDANRTYNLIRRGRSFVQLNSGTQPMHSKPIVDLAFSNDGTKFASVSGNDGLCLIWNWGETRPYTAYEHPFRLHSVAFHPDRPEVVCGGERGEVVILDSDTKNDFLQWMKIKENELEPIRTQIRVDEFSAHRAPINAIAFNEDGTLITAGDDRVIRTWNYDSQTQRKALRGHGDPVIHVRTVPGSDHLLTSISRSRQLRFWNLELYEDQREFKTPNERSAEFIRFSSDGEQFVTGSSNGILYLWNRNNTESPELEMAFNDDLGLKATYLPKSKRVVTSGANAVDVWENGRSILQIDNVGRDGHFAVSRNERLLITGGDGGVRRINPEDGEPYTDAGLAAYENAKPTLVWDLVTQKRVGQLLEPGHRNRVTAIAISNDGKFAATATGSTEGILTLFDLRTLRKLDQKEAHRGWISDLAFGNDNRLISADSLEGYVNVWKTDGGRLHRQKKLEDVLGSYILTSYAPDRNMFVTASSEKSRSTLKVWDSTNFSLVAKKTFPAIQDIEFRPNNKIGIVLGSDQIGTWNFADELSGATRFSRYTSVPRSSVNGRKQIEGGKLNFTFGPGFAFLEDNKDRLVSAYGNTHAVVDACFVAENTRIVALYANGIVRLWNIEKSAGSSERLTSAEKTWEGESKYIALDSSPDGSKFVVCSKDSSVIVDLAAGKETPVDGIDKIGIESVDWFDDETIYFGSDGNSDQLGTSVVPWNVAQKRAEEPIPLPDARGRVARLDVADGVISAMVIGENRSTNLGGELVVMQRIGILPDAPTPSSPENEEELLDGDEPSNVEPIEADELVQPIAWAWKKTKLTASQESVLSIQMIGPMRLVIGKRTGQVIIMQVPEAAARTREELEDKVSTGEPELLRQLITISNSDSPAAGVAISPDNQLILSASKDGKAVLWLTDGWEISNRLLP